MIKNLVLLIAVAVTALQPAASRADGAAKCFASWNEAAPVVKQQALTEIERVSALARPALGGAQIVKTTLCEDQGRYVYRLLVREPRGQLRTLLVDARYPFAQD